MIIFPVSHDRDTLTRWPVVTLSLVALCVLAHIWASMAEDPYEAFEDAIGYYLEHPYLETDPRLWGGALPDAGGDVTFQDLFQEEGQPSTLRMAREQDELDQLTDRWLAVLGGQPYQRFGLIPADYSVWHLVTYQFLHAGWLHLIGNIFLLYFAGAPLEDRWGRPLTLVFFLAAGAVAALVYAGTYPESSVPLVGASGGVAGIFGACTIRFWNTRIKFAYFIFMIRIYAGTFRAPAWLMLPFWFVGEVYSSYVSHALRDALPDGGGVAYLAHVGGFAFGAALALVIMMTGLNEVLKAGIHEKVGLEENPAVDAAYEASLQGDPWSARDIVERRLAEDPTQRDLIQTYWDMSVQVDEAEGAARRFCWLIQQELREREFELGLQHWDELMAYAPGAAVPPALTVLVLETYVEQKRIGEAREVVGRLEVSSVASMPPMLVPRLVEAVAAVDREAAVQIAKSGLARRELEPEQRSRIEQRIPVLQAEIEQARIGTPVMAEPEFQTDHETAAPVPSLTVTSVVPQKMDGQSLWLQVEGGKRARLGFARIRAIGAGHVAAAGTPAGLYLLDLIVALPEVEGGEIRTIRARSDSWDPRSLIPDEKEVGRALLALATEIQGLSRSRVVPAEPSPFQLQPFAEFDTVEAYDEALKLSLVTV